MRTIAVATVILLMLAGCGDRRASLERQAEAQQPPAVPEGRDSFREFAREWESRNSVFEEIERLKSEDPLERARAAARLGYLATRHADRVEGDPLDAVPHLISLLNDDTQVMAGGHVHPLRAALGPSTPGDEAAYAIRTLSIGRDLEVEPVLEALASASTAFERRNIARVLAYIPDERAMVSLVNLLDDADADVRAAAASALAALKSQKTIDPLLAAYEDGRIDRLTAVRSLGELAQEDHRVLDLMIQTARTGDEQERIAAITPLMYQARRIYANDRSDPRTERIVTFVLETLRSDPSEEVRYAAVPGPRSDFRRDLDEAILEALLQTIRSDPSPRVREWALRRFRESRRMQASEAVLIGIEDDAPRVRMEAFNVGYTLYCPAILREAGINALSDPAPEVRRAAARMLGRGSSRAVREALVETIVQDEDDDVRCVANSSLHTLLREFCNPMIQRELARALDPIILDTGESDRLRRSTAHTMLVALEGPYPDPGPDDMDVIRWWRKHRGSLLN